MKQHYLQIVRAFEESYEATRGRIVRGPSDPRYLGRTDDCLLAEPGYSVGEMHAAACLYACPESKYYKDTSLFGDLIGACKYILKCAHEDGTSDLLITNFQTPATFELHSLIRGYRSFMTAYSGTPEENEAKDWMEKAIAKLETGCINGGFHTPNHRWVETAALLAGYNIFGWQELKDKADKYLAEGIDCDEYGEFTERSPGMYNGVNDNALMMMAEEGDMPWLLPYVKKNMDLLFDYMEPDGSIFTQNSRRKDKGEGAAGGRFYPAGAYYHLYLWAGYKFNDKRYLKFAKTMFEDNIRAGRGTVAPLWLYMLIPELKTFEPDLSDVELPKSYKAFYPGSDIYRRRDDFYSYSLICDNPNFLYIRCGEMTVYVRICASFFAVAQFMPEKLEKTETGYRMSFHAHGDYRRPFDNPPPTPDWHKMDHSLRKRVNNCELYITVDFTDIDDGLKMDIKAEGTDGVPFKLEYVISPNCSIWTGDAVSAALPGGYMTVKRGKATLVHSKGETMTIDGCFAKHLYTTIMRGSVPQVRDSYTVYSTDYTPLSRTVELHFSQRQSVTTEPDSVF